MNCESCGHENLPEAHFCAKCGVQLAGKSEQSDWIGRLIGGRFRIKKVLGEGGMGVVYEGEQQMGSTVRRVAVKTLHQHLSADPSVLARFHRECGTVSQLEHPNTIKFYDFGKEQDGTLYIAMEYLDGRGLDKVLEAEGALPPGRMVKIMQQICGALDEAHAQGVIHRDLKPENVVLGEKLGEKNFVKLLDFGIAARSESADAQKEAKLTQQGMVLGTPPYMSPEQFTGAALDRRSDVYSLGVMAYEMLTGQLPFTANTPWQWATQHMTAQPFPIDQVPSGGAVPRPMRDAVMRALAKSPEERPATAGAFLALLEAGLAGATATINAPTEQMQAVPAFPSSPMSKPATLSGAREAASETLSEMSATQGFEIPKKKGSGGVIAGLVAGAVLLGGGAYFMRSGASKAPDTDASSGSASGEVAPGTPPSVESPAPVPTPAVPVPTNDPAPPAAGTVAPSGPGPKPAPRPGPAPAPSPTPAPSPAPAPTPTPAPAPEPAPSPGPQASPADECGSCIAAVKGGNWSAASGAYRQCSTVGKAKCSAVADRKAPSQITAAVKAKQCSLARSIEASANAMSASSAALKQDAKSCK